MSKGKIVAPRVSLRDVAEHGGYWCRRCAHYVERIVSDVGLPDQCPHCQGFSLRYDPAVPGYHPREAVA